MTKHKQGETINCKLKSSCVGKGTFVYTSKQPCQKYCCKACHKIANQREVLAKRHSRIEVCRGYNDVSYGEKESRPYPEAVGFIAPQVKILNQWLNPDY
jgi:hypothetical protein